ncbi:MAG: hypothetical protein K9J16_12755 [Melioribacteraceae bacterium]|nr:hypothetical protein [Melioribacteraceae bacterium]MCF8354726.1 hypothetical protein [Melioribacteraceae bacterium]MCF8394355.1 hypothetical protein [Melioribacteraceae bacterium]MCF8420065.1 hypothetical protein [Melioribacteraceae bacterium]
MFNKKRITSFGEILFDIYEGKKKLGGAPFNFIYHIKKLTGYGEFISKVGNDDDGYAIKNFVSRNGFKLDYIQTDEIHPTGAVYVLLDENKIPSFKISANRAYDFIERNSELDKLIDSNTDMLYFGTLVQRNDVSRETLKSFFRKNLKCFYDINLRQNYYSVELIVNSLINSSIVKVNKDELNFISENILQKPFGLYSSSRELIDNYDLDLLCVTLGADGAFLIDKNDTDKYRHFVPDVVDTVGAGDAYSAVLCLGYLNKWSIQKINKIASKFSADICRVNGALPDDEKIYTDIIGMINDTE